MTLTARSPLVAFALALLLGLSALLTPAALAGKKALAHTTVTVTDFDGHPVKGAELLLERKDGEERLTGATDKDGQWVVDLVEGQIYAVTVTVEGKVYKFGDKEIPDVGGPLNFALNLKVKSSASAISTTTLTVNRTETRTTVTVMNSAGEPEPDAVVRFVGVDTDARFEGRTDSNGQWLLTLPRAKTFQISADKYGVTFDLGSHPIPDVDSFILNLKLRLERHAFIAATAGAGAGAGAGATAEQSIEATQVIVTVKVFDNHKNPESDATITLTPKGGKGEPKTGVTDSSGRFILLLPAGETYGLTVQKYGLTAEAGEHTIPNAETFEIAQEVSLAATYLETYRLENVYFDTAKATLRPESFAPLDELVTVMKAHPTMVIELAGHTDSRGDDTYNLNLSRARANSVRDYVVSRGIDAQRLAAKGYGEFEPVAPNDTDPGMQLNRRTEVRIITR